MNEVKCTCEKPTPNLVGRCNNCYEKSAGEIHMRALSENRVQMSEGKKPSWIIYYDKFNYETWSGPSLKNSNSSFEVIERSSYNKAIKALKLAKSIMLRNSMFPGDIEKFNELVKEMGE